MIIGPRRAILIGAVAAVAIAIIMIPLIFSFTAPDFSKVKVSLSEVTVVSADDKSIQLRPVITIENPTDQALTTSRVEYQLFADGAALGSNTVSYEDTPLNGRPAIFSGGSVEIPPLPGQPYVLEYNSSIADIYAKIRDNPDSVQWRASGEVALESTLVQQPIQFDSTL